MTAFPRARPVGQQQRQPRQPRPHAFVDSGQRDYRTAAICGECGSLRMARVHELPEQSDDEREVRDRIVGEGQ